jgi:NAD(P)H-quinone oxidoreductase subunit 4L
MLLNQFLILAAVLFGIGMYGVLVRRNGVLVLMSVELMLNALNLIAFSARLQETSGQVFSLFVITIAAAEVGVGLAIILLLFRNFRSPDLDEVHQMKG